MQKNPLKNLVIRTAVVRSPSIGYILACDIKKEQKDVPHTYVFKWKEGVSENMFEKSKPNYYKDNAHTTCIIEKPEPGLVYASDQGYYNVVVKDPKNNFVGDITGKNSQPPPKKRRFGSIRSVSEIDGKAYAIGLRGIVYRLDELKMWTRIDEGLPDTFNAQAIDGFTAEDIYAAGRNGGVWHYNGKKWTKCELSTNGYFSIVKCAGDGKVYVAGHDGILVRGREDKWEIVEHNETKDDIWDLEWFAGQLYVSTMHDLYSLKGNHLEPVNFGKDKPKSCYQLSIAPGVMWSNGEFDIMSFDGKKWTRII